MSLGQSLSMRRDSYPDPFMDFASLTLPKSREKLYELCRIVAMTQPQIAAIVRKLAKYTITSVIFTSKEVANDEALQKRWGEYFDNEANILELAEGVGLDFFTYGNAYVLSHRPFQRVYICNHCKESHPAESRKLLYNFSGESVVGKCPACKRSSKFEAKDLEIRSMKGFSMVRLNPADVQVKKNSLTGKRRYYCSPPGDLKSAVRGTKIDRELIDETPWQFVMAALKRKRIEFKDGTLLHLMEPSPAGVDDEVGLPRILPALKLVYLDQVYKKSDEAAALERTLPLRFVFPQPSSESPLDKMPLAHFSRFLAMSLRRWRHDKNAVVPSSFPVGVSELGGDANTYNSAPMRNLTRSEIIGAMAVPEGFLSDGMTWSGGSVQLRMLENSLIGMMRALNRLCTYVETEIQAVSQLPACGAKMKNFRQLDDIQQLGMKMSLAQQRVISWKTVCDAMDLNFDEEQSKISQEDRSLQDNAAERARAELRNQMEALKTQALTAGYQQGYGQIDQDMQQSTAAAQAALVGSEKYVDARAQQDQQQEQQGQQESQKQQQDAELQQEHQKAQLQSLKSQGAKSEAQALQAKATAKREISQSGKLDEHGEFYRQNSTERKDVKLEGYVKKLVEDVVKMDQEGAVKYMGKLWQATPDVAQLVASELERRKSKAKGSAEPILPQENQQSPSGGGGEDQSQLDAEIAQMRANAKSPEALANRIKLMEPARRMAIIFRLVNTDPSLGREILMKVTPQSVAPNSTRASSKPPNPVMPPKV